jgi:hypothetical protein
MRRFIMTETASSYASVMREELAHGASLGHVFSNIGTGVSDQAKCSCGWVGSPFWDASDLAQTEWYSHVVASAGDGQMHFNFEEG